MIQGLVPLITLWCIVGGSVLSLVLHAATRWWHNQMATHLFWYFLVVAVWYTEILVASYAGYPPAMQWVQGITFILIAVVILWRAGLQSWWAWKRVRAWWRRRRLAAAAAPPSDPTRVR